MTERKNNDKKILATDLDGTLIPLPGNQANAADLAELTRLIPNRCVTLVFVTGRHLESVEAAIIEHGLPIPDWIICNVGTSLFQKSDQGWLAVADYQARFANCLGRPSFRRFTTSSGNRKFIGCRRVRSKANSK